MRSPPYASNAKETSAPHGTRGGRWLIAGFFLVLALDAVKHVFVYLAGPAPLIFDTLHYWQLGQSLVEGDWQLEAHPMAFRTPAYPAFLAVFQAACGEHALAWIAALQHLMAMVTAGVVAWTCGKLASSLSAAFVAYLLAALCMSRAGYANVILTETCFTLLLALHLAAATAYHLRPSWRAATAAGLLLGLATLTRPVSIYLWAPIFGSFLLHSWRDPKVFPWRQTLTQAAVASVLMWALLAPWQWRNWMMFSEPVVSKFVGRNLWITTFRSGSCADLPLPETKDAARLLALVRQSPRDVDLDDTWRVSAALTSAGLSDPEADDLMKRVATQAALSDPVRFGTAWLRRIVNFWRCVSDLASPGYPDFAPADWHGQWRWGRPSVAWRLHRLSAWFPSRHLRANEAVTLATFGGVIGLCLSRRTRLAGFTLGLMLVYFDLATSAVEIPEYRYRLVVEPLMIVATVAGFWVWSERLKSRGK